MRIVGIGASAGGLEAVSRLLETLPNDLGVAVAVIEHLHPKHDSVLPQLLANSTSMPVAQVTDGLLVQPNHVYVIPPGTVMQIAEGQLRLAASAPEASRRTPIDVFLGSLAQYADGKAIAVILSGSGTDGVIGLRQIKAAGGIVLVQDPDTARFDGMPRAAVATNIVDFVGAPEALAAELARIARHPYLEYAGEDVHDDALGVREEDLPPIFTLLRRETDVDFSVYKTPSLRRRLQRRMVLHKLQTFDDYLRLLRESPAEVRALFADILIHVTSFFREPDTFEVLKSEVFPKLCALRDPAIRVWIPACSTGEEAYSVAISLLEFLGSEAGSVPIQIFATDVSEDSVDVARRGHYPEGIAADVSPERLRRFFTKDDHGYHIKQAVREVCIFARQDVTRDPPFSKLDLILCRNLLIYLTMPAQRRLLNVFHYALRNHGFLMLGEAENIGGKSDLFAVVDQKRKLFARRLVETPMHLDIALTPRHVEGRGPSASHSEVTNISREASRLLLDRFAPPAVIVDQELQIEEVRGQVGAYLELPSGRATLDVGKLAREGLAHGLRAAIHEARKSQTRVRREGIRVRDDSSIRRIDIEIIPFAEDANGPHLLIVFDETAARVPATVRKTAESGDGETADLEDLEAELSTTREHMQSVIQDLEAANEELQSANEEVLSSNEELQSTNEELDTAREELQSTNEELNTVNEELQIRNDELQRANSDLVNLLASVQIAIVIVAGDLTIRRFTPMAERVLNLMAGDIGRPIAHIKPNVDLHDLDALIRRVIDEMTPMERDVQGRDGRWFSLRVRPYRNTENQIDGAVVGLFDVTVVKQHEQESARARTYAEAVIDCVSDPLVVLDKDLRIQSANRAFLETFNIAGQNAGGMDLRQLGEGEWANEELRGVMSEMLSRNGERHEREVVAELPRLGRRRVRLRTSDDASGSQDGKFLLLTILPAPTHDAASAEA